MRGKSQRGNARGRTKGWVHRGGEKRGRRRFYWSEVLGKRKRKRKRKRKSCTWKEGKGARERQLGGRGVKGGCWRGVTEGEGWTKLPVAKETKGRKIGV